MSQIIANLPTTPKQNVIIQKVAPKIARKDRVKTNYGHHSELVKVVARNLIDEFSSLYGDLYD